MRPSRSELATEQAPSSLDKHGSFARGITGLDSSNPEDVDMAGTRLNMNGERFPVGFRNPQSPVASSKECGAKRSDLETDESSPASAQSCPEPNGRSPVIIKASGVPRAMVLLRMMNKYITCIRTRLCRVLSNAALPHLHWRACQLYFLY